MTSASLRIAGQTVGAVGAIMGTRTRTRGGVVLTYHDVTDRPEYLHQQVSPDELRAQLTTAIELGISFVDLAELTDRAIAGDQVDGMGAVVFDDAFVGVGRHGVPVLAELGLPFTVFAPSARLGERDPDWYEVSDRVMTATELRDVADAGGRIESHTRTHANLPSLDDRSLDDELRGSRQELEDLVGSPVRFLAYPSGYFDSRVVTATADAGYDAAFTFVTGRIVPGLDRFRLPRRPMPARASALHVASLLRRPAWSLRDHRRQAVTAGG
jgi:peptidoglycan/xylan/chitin deacetylase (PgdA/CDA1 family)